MLRQYVLFYILLSITITSCARLPLNQEPNYASATELPKGTSRAHLTIAKEENLTFYELIIESDRSQVNIALLSHFGQAVVTYQLKGVELNIIKSRYASISVHEKVLFRDLQLLLWPRSSLKALYGANISGDHHHLALHTKSAITVQTLYNGQPSDKTRKESLLINKKKRYSLELQFAQ